MLKMQVSTQTDNHEYRESGATEQSTFFKTMGLRFWNPEFNILCKIAFICYIKCQPFGVQGSVSSFMSK